MEIQFEKDGAPVGGRITNCKNFISSSNLQIYSKNRELLLELKVKDPSTSSISCLLVVLHKNSVRTLVVYCSLVFFS